MRIWLQTAAEAFQSQNLFTSKDHGNWDGNCTWHFKPTTIFSAKLTPNFGQNEQLHGWFGPNNMRKWLQISAETFQSQNWFISKVYKAWDGNRTWVFNLNTLFSAMPSLKFSQQWTVWGLLWPKSHVNMIVDCCRNIRKSNLIHNQGLQSLGWESYMEFWANYSIFCQADPQFEPKTSSSRADLAQTTCAHGCRLLWKHSKSKLVHEKGLKSLGWEPWMVFSSKHTIYCQADPQIWPDMTNFGTSLAQITCAHGCRQLQKHSKVKIGSQARTMATGMGIAHGIWSQLQHLPSWPPILAKNELLQGWFGPNNMCKWLKIATEAFQSQNWFISKVYKAWDGNRTWLFYPNTPCSAKSTPNFGQ